ncbi:protein O-glucosyltransferase 1-like isoform X2 [Punica granatum]|uniref:Protein O-glucosyltransferase 1-like isoform X2 n=2 Tax=Punica granatum TaxID=22663 RepID=A0A218VV85_PUNGR|nr:protein O-glucosyltransferase 1-like isoform X2 [Punica granatum]OWM64233.1 hypothetical protein CDL15_Pgr018805 [Punica granatum]
MFCHDDIVKLRRHLALVVRWQQLKKRGAAITAVLFFSIFALVGAIVNVAWINGPTFSSAARMALFGTPKGRLKCTNSSGSLKYTCPRNNYPTDHQVRQSSSSCPSYFQWIHEDLRPWREMGITQDMIRGARKTAHFKLVIVNGRAYMEKYKPSLPARDQFTLWGILQLLRWYPGRLPDLELMFDCDDRPVIRRKDFQGPRKPPPPPLFRYCRDDWTLDIVFPDWTFWGWPDVNIKPWKQSLKDIKEGNERTVWEERVPYAYWRGNPYVCPSRQDLLKCNVSDKYDWNARLYIQNWNEQAKAGFKQSNLANQCTHRYKIYVEGWAWSVSEKYIFACDSMTLRVRPNFYDFFARGMVPLKHFWPIRDNSKCTSLKFAVEWGNNYTDKAKGIAEAGSQYIHEDVKMEYVYDFMFHILNEYAKLLRFKPTVPAGAVELCPEVMLCNATGRHKEFMIESMVESPSESAPCTLPLPYEPAELQAFLDLKANSTRQVEMWENEYWQNQNRRN